MKTQKQTQNVLKGYTVIPLHLSLFSFGDYEYENGKETFIVEVYQSRSDAIKKKKELAEDNGGIPSSEFKIVPVRFMLRARNNK